MATTMKKRIYAIAILAIFLAVLAIPALAADYTNGLAGQVRVFRSFNGQTNCGVLNAYPLTSQGVIAGTPLRIWRFENGSNDQYFKGQRSTGGYLVLKVKTAPSGVPNSSEYSLMVNRSSSTGNAILWTEPEGFFDSNMLCSGNQANGYRFRLANYSGEYLNAQGGSNGSIINFATDVGGQTSSLWAVFVRN